MRFRRRKNREPIDLTALARLQEVRRKHEIDQAMLNYHERVRLL